VQFSLLTHYSGELAALSAALSWAIASVLYTRLGKQIDPLGLNLAKNGIAIALIALLLLIQGKAASGLNGTTLSLLILSGVVGIGFGDTVFFETLNCIGVRRALLMESLAPPLTALLAVLFLNEQLSVQSWLGILLTIGGVTWVVVERVPDVLFGHTRLWRGIGFGALAAIAQASGSVLSRAALADTAVSPLWSSLIRLTAGAAILVVWTATKYPIWRALKPLKSIQILLLLIGASFIGTFLATWFQQTALKYTPAGIAQSLTATSPLFVLPIALWLGERVSLRAILGVLVALAGIWLLFASCLLPPILCLP
jgi:drug/metabolite transporter (DMT)-like permease